LIEDFSSDSGTLSQNSVNGGEKDQGMKTKFKQSEFFKSTFFEALTNQKIYPENS